MIQDLSSIALEITGEALGSELRLTLYRQHDLQDREGIVQSALELVSPASIGDSSVALQLSGAARLKGRVPAGVKVTLGSQERLVSSDASASANAITLTLTAPLTTALLAGDAASLESAAEFDFTDLVCVQQPMSEDLGFEEYTATPRLEILIPKLGAPTAPILGDVIENEAGDRCKIVGKPFDNGGVWAVACGGF